MRVLGDNDNSGAERRSITWLGRSLDKVFAVGVPGFQESSQRPIVTSMPHTVHAAIEERDPSDLNATYLSTFDVVSPSARHWEALLDTYMA